MDIIEIKRIADKALGSAQGLLMIDKYLTPVIFTISGSSVTPVMVNGEDIKYLNDLVHKLAKTCESLFLITESYVLDVTDRNCWDIPEDISTHPEASESVNCILFTKDTTLIRQLCYIKDGSNNYSFHDLGWDDLRDSKHSFQNPFLAGQDEFTTPSMEL